MLLEGMQLGRYRLSRLLGSGGMGEVYLGEDTHIRRQVAVKVTRAEAAPYPNSEAAKQATRLFQREVRAIAMLDHPYILPLFDYGEQETDTTSLTYMVMPYREEGSLSIWLRQRSEKQSLTPQEVAHFIKQAASALAYAHRHQIIHQDVKPSNFLIRNNEMNSQLPDLLLADFGVAKFTSASASMSQSSRGTPTYMSPEQWSGQPVAASDQYALAIMAYQLLTGTLPFQGRQEQVMYMHFNVQPQPASTLNPDIPKDVDTVILRALAKKPEERFASISAFANAFQKAVVLPEPPKITNPLQDSGQSSASQSLNVSGASNADIRATVAISQDEITTGTTRTLNLPGGRRITVPIPSGIPDGQVIRFDNQGETASNGATGALVLTISVVRDTSAHAEQRGNENKTVLSDPGRSKKQMPPPNSTESRKIGVPVRRLRLPRSRVALIAGLVLLIVLVSSGIAFYAINANQNNSNNSNSGITNNSSGVQNPYPPNSGTLALNDPLTDNSRGYLWEENSNCIFRSDGYHNTSSASASTGGTLSSEISSCFATNGIFARFAYQIQMRIVQGEGEAGIIFRADKTKGNFYFFFVGGNGTSCLDVYANNIYVTTIKCELPQNPQQSNLLAVVANGSQIDIYVNNQHLDSLTDRYYDQGAIGVAVADNAGSTEATFTNAKIWTF